MTDDQFARWLAERQAGGDWVWKRPVACEGVSTDSIYLVSPRRVDDTDETWARRQGVIRNVGQK
jgi:hypothetical protein